MSSISEPLFIDTNIEYELDMSRFPGWEDPEKRLQPKLLIHKPENCLCEEKHDLYSLLDSCSELSCTENDDCLEDSDSDDDIVDSLLSDSSNDSSVCSNAAQFVLTSLSAFSSLSEGAHFAPIWEPMLPLPSNDSGTDSVFEYLSESYISEDRSNSDRKKRRLSVDEFDDDLPLFKRPHLDESAITIIDNLFVDYGIEDGFMDSVFRGY